MKHSLRVFFLAIACASLCVGFSGCKGGRVPGSTNGAPHLDDVNAAGDYMPYYQTGEMHQPRYVHQAIRLKNGHIFVAGGSDERGFSALDSAEIFDETTITKDEPRPPSLTGVWFDTDFEGNPMTMGFRRLWHTMTLLPDNRVMIVGGAANWLKAVPVEKVEVFDPDKRTFETLKDVKLIVPRVRHTTMASQDGTIVIAGGQFHDLFIDLQTNPSNVGNITVTTQTDIFPSTPRVEVVNFRELKFSELTLLESTRVSTLTSSRGRTGHTAVQFAGPDNLLNSGDDLFLLVGGFQTPTAPQIIPTSLLPHQPNTLVMRNLEVYDPTIHVFSQVGTILLEGPRVNDPQGTNLGIFNEKTPDDVLGLGNVMLICNGDDDAPNCPTTTEVDEIFTVTFTGFGPAQGLTIHRISGQNQGGEEAHEQGIELKIVDPLILKTRAAWGRSMTNIVPLPRSVEARPGVLAISTWVFDGAGFASHPVLGGCQAVYNLEIAAGTMFDPLYHLLQAPDFSLVPKPNARDLKPTRDALINPTGVVGTWLTMDGKLPSTDRVGFADTNEQFWPSNLAPRVLPRLISLPGEDGISGTPDDRVLFTGGGQNGLDLGGEVSAPSAEIFLNPKSPP